MDTPADATKSWRAWVNLRYGATPAEPCPTWATPAQQQLWRESGLTLWNDAAQRVIHLTRYDILSLLHLLNTTRTWHQDGIDVGTMIPTHPLSDDLPTQIRPSTLIHLNPTEAQMLFTMLRPYEAELQREHQQTKVRIGVSLVNAARLLGRWLREKDIATMDFATRPLPWVATDSPLTWHCDLPPNRVTISVMDTGTAWQGCLERPHLSKRWSQPFVKLIDVVTWAEQELATAATVAAQEPTQAPKPRLSPATLTPAQRKRLKPYWIEPKALEPPHLTYRTVIYLEHIPISRKTLELSFGELYIQDEMYPTAVQVAQKLSVNTEQDELYPMCRGKLYRITSLATYAQVSHASQQAQARWDGSTIAAAYRSGQVVYAAYGIEEVETGYRAWLGGFGEWSRLVEERDAFLAEQAFERTLVHALDVQGYRDRFQLSERVMNDTELLMELHTDRAASPHIPSTARAESEQWLHERRTAKTPLPQPLRNWK